MPQLSSVVENNIRLLLRDARLNDTAIGSFQLKRLIENRLFYCADRFGTGEVRTSAAIAITANAYEFALGVSPASVIEVLFDAFAWPLTKVTEEDIDSLRAGVPSGSFPSSARPLYYALVYRGADVWRIQVHPPASGTLTLVARLMPGLLGDAGAVSIDFDEGVLRGLEQLAAADAIDCIVPDKAAERGLSQGTALRFERLGEAALDAAWPRVNQGRLRDYVQVRMGARY